MKLPIRILIFLHFFIIYRVYSQEMLIKNPFYEHVDSLYGNNFFITSISKNGKWSVLKKKYDLKESEYFLLKNDNSLSLSLKNSSSNQFSPNDKWFGSLDLSNNLKIMDLKNSNLIQYQEVKTFQFIKPEGKIVILKTTGDLELRDLNKNETINFKYVQDFSISLEHNKIAFQIISSNEPELIIYDYLKNDIDYTFKGKKGSRFEKLHWNKKGDFLVLEKNEANSILLISNKVIRQLSSLETMKLESEFQISNTSLSLSEDGSKVYFCINEKNEIPKTNVNNNSIEIWETSDLWIKPKLETYQNYELNNYLVVWDVDKDSLFKLTDKETPSFLFNADQPYILTFNKLKYEPNFKQDSEVDIYLKYLDNSTKELIIEQQYLNKQYINISHSGKYIAYFKDSNWWIYETSKKISRNISEQIPYSLIIKDYNHPYGSLGWTLNEENFIFYDSHDIWLISMKDFTSKRVTNGRETNIKYRIERDIDRIHDSDKNTQNVNIKEYNPKKGIILSMTGSNLKTGLAIWKDNQVHTLFYDYFINEDALITPDHKNIVYKKHKYDLSPALYIFDIKKSTEKHIFSSNPAFDKLNWRKHEFLMQDDSNNALILFPINYNSSVSYPIIVKLYEKYSPIDIQYSPPSDYHEIGFNLTNYLLNGYIIIIPHINYENKNPGFSASASLNKIIDSLVAKYPIDQNKMGIIGHSFGGYETEFIITQTNKFAAAVAGAAVSDLSSYYHDVSWNSQSEQIWRMENQQFRMGYPYHLTRENYQKNSPLNHTEKIKTPLLLWTGKKDTNTNWSQSIYMFNSLRRQNKIAKLILFENEAHSISDKENQQILSLEIFKWFESHLK